MLHSSESIVVDSIQFNSSLFIQFRGQKRDQNRIIPSFPRIIKFDSDETPV